MCMCVYGVYHELGYGRKEIIRRVKVVQSAIAVHHV